MVAPVRTLRLPDPARKHPRRRGELLRWLQEDAYVEFASLNRPANTVHLPRRDFQHPGIHDWEFSVGRQLPEQEESREYDAE